MTESTPGRREFLGVGMTCAAHLMWAQPGAAWSGPAPGEPWGRLESVAPGVWALISTPLEDRTTLCNGGIIAGTSGTMVVESFGSVRGAEWMAGRARELTGRSPTHVVLTHYHGDHTNGLEGFRAVDAPTVLATDTTRSWVQRADAERSEPPTEARRRLLVDLTVLSPTDPSMIDLGGREVRIVPREGHTASDVTIELVDPSVVFCGDLVWNHMFPNYRDAVPSRLARDVRALLRPQETAYVPGHGPMADRADLDRYLAVIDAVEHAARAAYAAGIPAARAAKSFALPPSLGEWMLFSARYFQVAFGAWERELHRGP